MKPSSAIFLATLASSLLSTRPALARSLPSPLSGNATDEPVPTPTGKRANLTVLLTVNGHFHTFLKYLQQTNLIETFRNQAYRTEQGITIFAPVDKAFASVEPSVLSGLSKSQVKSLILYHSLARHYALAGLEGLSQENPVTTFAGGRYMVNVTYDDGSLHVRSKWTSAKISGTVYATAPLAVYQLDRVLLPDALFRAEPPVAATPPAPAPAPSGTASQEGAFAASDGIASGHDHKGAYVAGGESSCGRAGAWHTRYAAAAAFGALLLAL